MCNCTRTIVPVTLLEGWMELCIPVCVTYLNIRYRGPIGALRGRLWAVLYRDWCVVLR